MVQILIGSDVCPMGSMEKPFIDGDFSTIFNDLLPDVKAADLAIVNLECPLISEPTPINKAGGYVLGASAGCIRGFSTAGWHLMNLANNHSFDQGERGLRKTMEVIREAGMSFVGAGVDLREARIPYVTEIAGQRITVYSMAEREYSVAGENSPGANPLDLSNFVEAIRNYKEGGVFIVLLHGGTDCAYPSPEMVKRCRLMVDMGADAVVCSHAHRPQPWELYRGSPIVYGMGNFVFEELVDPLLNPPTGWHEGYLVRLKIEAGKVDFDTIPYFQCRPVLGATRMGKPAEEVFFAEMQARNERLSDANFLALEWSKYCEKEKEKYLTLLFGYNRWMRKFRGILLRRLHSKEDVLRSLQLVQCETHLEVLHTLLPEAKKNLG
jgi:poly-gamma-glutamate capsule biosynthesis protein CapA/YwtB (metallophosphatase superfamily)